MAFWRRKRGRHSLGAAVTSIPTTAPVAPAPVASPLPPAPPAQQPAVDLRPASPPAPESYAAVPPYAPSQPEPLDWSFPELAPPTPPEPRGPRVELTFRDGSSASLDPVQARALDEIAQVLTRRDRH